MAGLENVNPTEIREEPPFYITCLCPVMFSYVRCAMIALHTIIVLHIIIVLH